MFDWCVIGGGASGMYASILLAKNGYSVAVLEANDRVGKKLLATGNGKCNLTNEYIDLSCYNSNEIGEIISSFNLKEQFLQLGLVSKIKSGRVYPFSEQASSVLNVLRANMQKYGVQEICDCKVQDILLEDNIKILTSKGKFVCQKVCLACGSNASFGTNSLNLFQKLGHKVQKTSPALCPMNVSNIDDIKGLNGVRQEAMVSMFAEGKLVAKEFGEVQFRKDSISGIVILNHSSHMAWNNLEKAELSLDFMPNYSVEQVQKLLDDNITFNFGLLHKNLMTNIQKRGISSVKDYKIMVSRNYDFKQAQVAHGGLKLCEFDLKNMRSKIDDRLYAIGEALNVDGLCGGYNLHWAFASAWTLAKEETNASKIK